MAKNSWLMSNGSHIHILTETAHQAMCVCMCVQKLCISTVISLNLLYEMHAL